ncbi:MAG: Clp protease ClpP [Candidatus Cloacimonetes bacterium]|nr:Clp protease ClpP [Candidatus Cloacimonadota bacterium]
MDKKKFWKIRNEADGENVEILFYGDISSETWYGDEITPKQFAADLASLGGKDVTLRINSPGGDVFAAQAIYNQLKSYNGCVTAKIDGICASAATIVACAAQKVCMPKNAVFMIHNPVVALVGYYGASEAEKIADYLSTVKDTIINVYMGRVKVLTENKLSKLMDNETWMSADEAFDYGFVDEIDILAAVDDCVNGAMVTLNSVTVDTKKFKNSTKLTEILAKNKEEKPLKDNEILGKIKSILGFGERDNITDGEQDDVVHLERERITELEGVHTDNEAVRAIINTAKRTGQTLAEIQPFIDAMPAPAPDSSKALEAIRNLITDEMHSGAEDIKPQPTAQNPQNSDDVKKRAAIDEVVRFANTGKR